MRWLLRRISKASQTTNCLRNPKGTLSGNPRGIPTIVSLPRNGNWCNVCLILFYWYVFYGSIFRYGNWLLDHGLMKLPSYIFVCASTLIPAFVRIGQLPSLLVPLKTLPKVGRAMKHVQGKVGSTPFKDTDVVLEEKRKHFLVTYFKSEVGALPEVSLLFRCETTKLRFRCKTKIPWNLSFRNSITTSHMPSIVYVGMPFHIGTFMWSP